MNENASKLSNKILKLREKIEDLERQAENIQHDADSTRALAEKCYKESLVFSKQADDLMEKYLDCLDTEKSAKLYVEQLVAQTNADTSEKLSEKYETEADKLDEKAQNLKFKAIDLRTEMEDLKRRRHDALERRRREKEYSDFNAFMERENERIRQRVSGENTHISNISAQVSPKPYKPVETPEPPKPVEPAKPQERKHLPVVAFDFKKKSNDMSESYDGNFGEVDAGLSALYNNEKAGYEESTYIFKESYGKKKRHNEAVDDDDFNDD